MARYIELPDGSALKLKEGQSPVEGMMAARQLFPELFKSEEKPKEDTKGFKAAAAAGFERLKGETALTAAKLGLKDIGEAEAYQKEKQAAAAKRFTPTQDSFIESPLQNVKELLGGSVPYMLAPAAAGLAALAAPVSAPVAAGLGLLGAGAVSTGQFTGSNLARQMDTGKSLEETSLGKAAAAAVPQALIDTAAMALLPGVGKLFGSVGSKLTTEQAKAIASQTLTRTIADYTAKTGVAMGREGVTEATQQALERLQAGLELDSPEARKEYIDSFIGGAVLGGTLAPVGRAFERGGAKRQAAAADRAEALQRSSEQLQQQKTQEEAAEKALKEERQSPEYAKSVVAQYDALQKQKQDLIAQKRKIVDASPTADADRAFNVELNQQLKAVTAEIKPLAGEYNRVQPIIQQEAEKQRVAGMSPEEYMLEQTQTVPDTKTKAVAPDLGGLYEQQIASPSDALGTYAKSRLDLARDQVAAPDVKDYVDYLMQDVPTARRLVETRTQLPGLKAAEQRAVFGGIDLQLKALEKQRIAAGRAGTGAAQQRLSAVEEEEQAALEASRAADVEAAEKAALLERMTPEMQALQRMKRAPSPMTENLGLFGNEEATPSTSAAFGQLQQRLQGIPLEEGTLPTAEDVGPEGEQQRVIKRVSDAEFKLHPRAENTGEVITAESLRDRIDRVLSTYTLSPEAAVFLRRAEQVIPEADTTLKQEASGRANQENVAGEVVADRGVLKNVSESQGFLTLLDRQLTKIESGAEGVPRKGAGRPVTLKTFPLDMTGATAAKASTTTPTEPFKKDVDSITGAAPGQAASVSQTEMYAQRERLERTGKPGKLPGFVTQPKEAERTTGEAAQPTVEKRGQEINKPVYRTNPVTGKQELVSGTIRGKSAEALPLSLQAELEPLVRLSETVRDEQAGQLPLFGAADERSRVQKAERRGIEAGPSLDIGARPDVESFQRFINSPYVRKLKKDMQQSEKDLAPVRAFLSRALPRLKQMLKDSKATTARMSKIKNWTKFLKENQELTAFQTNTENMVLKMNNLKLSVSDLDARIKSYEQAKEDLIKEANRAGVRARGGAPEIKFFKELDDLISLHQEAKAEYTQTKGAMDLVRTQIKVLVGEQRLAELKATTDPLAKSNAAAQDEIKRLQEAVRTAQAEVGEAETKERQAAADKAQAVQGAKAGSIQALEKQISDERTRRLNVALSGFSQGVQVRALSAAERDARDRGLTSDAAGEVKYNNDMYNKPLLSLILELGRIDEQLRETEAAVLAAKRKSSEYAGGVETVLPLTPELRGSGYAMAFKGMMSAIRLQSRLSVRKGLIEDAINFMRARNVPLKKTLGAEPEVRSASIEEQDAIDQYIEQVQELGKATDRLADLNTQRDIAIKEGKTKTVARLNEQIDAVNTEISVGTEDKARLAVALQGRVSAGARQTTSAPAKFRTGTAESKRNVGSVKQPLVEQRNIKAPSVAQAVAEANAFAEQRAAGEKDLTKAQLAAIEAERQAEFQVILERRDEELTNKLNDAKDRLTGMQARAARPPTGRSNMPSLEDIKNAELDVADYDWERRAVRQELEAVKKALYQSANEADIRAAEEAAAEPVEKEAKPRGRRRKVTEEDVYGEATRTEGAVEDVYFGEDEGKAAFRTVTRGPTSLQTAQVERLAERITKGWVNAPEIVVVATEADLPVRIRGQIVKADRAEGTTPGLFDTKTKKVYLIASNLSNANDVILTLAHEAAGHYGLRELLGDKYTGTMNSLYRGNPEVRKQADAKQKADKSLSREVAVEEVLAEMAEDPNPTPAEKSALRQIYERLRAWLRSVIGLPNITDAEVQQIVANARRYVIEGVRPIAAPDSAAFKNWFGDSKVVDKNGNPLVVYHGTDQDLDVLKSSKQLEREGVREVGYTNGIYAASNPAYAGRYGVGKEGANVMPVYLSMKNPKVLEYNAFQRIVAKLTGYTDSKSKQLARSMAVSDKDLEEYKRQGYDGLINKEIDEFVVFEPTQIKSAIGNRGTYSPTESSILYRTKAAAEPDNALIALSKQITTQPKTLKEKLSNNLALQAEMQAVDMRAGLRDTLKFGDDNLFTQAMYHVRKAEQKMAQMFTVMNSGPLVAYRDSKGFVGYRSSNENSAREVFDAIADIPVTDPQLKTNIAQTYMVAQRASNKGLSKLDLGALGITQEQLTAALAAADADPALKKALENVRSRYNAYNKGMIEFLASTGRITKKVAADLLKEGDYVPFYRVDKDGNADLVFNNNVTFNVGDIRRQPYLAELKGGDTKLLPLNEALQRNTLLLTDMALTNNAAKSVAYGMQALGKGKGPVDPKTGKPTDLMAIKKGLGPADAKVIRFYQEPDPNKPDDKGERHIVVDTRGTAAEGIPAELVVQSLEGASLALPGFFKLGGAAADLLRAGVTRTPLYIARKLLREPMAASFTGGLDSNVFSSVFKAGAEYLRMSTGNSDMQAKLIEKGLIQSNIFAGDMSDMKKMALQLASGKDQGALDKVLAAADRYAMRADAATLALVLKNAEANGLSEVEADMATMESMNFYKRGLSPTLQYASRLIPFFNAQIQGLNVLYKAARGQMPFEEQQQIQRKFFNNAMLLMGTGIVYAMAMDDDETFRNARPRDKYANFFLPIPGVDEPLKLPIPFEAGYFFSLAVAAVDGMRAETDGKAQFQALKDLFLGSIPGYSSMGVPALVKPAFEVWTDKNFLTGGTIEPRRMQGYDTEERYLATTTELAKQMSKLLPILSPIQIEHIVRGYLGVLPLVAAAGANGLFEREGKGERPAGRASDLPLVGTAFQKKYGGGDADVVYREAQEAVEANATFKKMLGEGRREEAVAYRDKNKVEMAMAPAAGQYRQIIGRINTDIRRTQERDDLTAEEKRLRLDALDKAKQDRADAFIRQSRAVEARLGGG
jgi:hypothetical protein